MSPILYVLIFLATVLALEGLYHTVQARRRSEQAIVQRRLRVLSGRLRASDVVNESSDNSILRPVSNSAGNVREKKYTRWKRGVNRPRSELQLFSILNSCLDPLTHIFDAEADIIGDAVADIR